MTFEPGLTLIVGANGLGKSTLVALLYRMLTGPFDIPGIQDGSELGTSRLEPVRLSDWASGTFARRVSNGASGAEATVVFDIAGHEFQVGRRMDTMALVSLTVDGDVIEPNDIDQYQPRVIEQAGLGAFADWILLLRQIVFYFEDRRALVWDPSAQRQILRLLFLPAAVANEWTQLEREILTLDSRMRNLQAALGREQRELAKIEMEAESAVATRAELERLGEQLDLDKSLDEAADAGLHELDLDRANARLRYLAALQTHEGRLRDLERDKLLVVTAAFPSGSETARYVLAQLMAGDECLVCGNTVPAAAEALSQRIEAGHCVVCASPIDKRTGVTNIEPERVARAVEALHAADRELSDAARIHAESDLAHSRTREELAFIRQRVAQNEQRMSFLLASLPPEEAAVHERRSGLSLLATRVEEMKHELAVEREAFGSFIDRVSRTIVERAAEVKEKFDGYASGFLVEECDLTWAPNSARVGQSGEAIFFPSFELTLTGSDFDAPTRRSGPGDVSESQREFIDLAFRMSLISVAGFESVGTIVIDAPESSLDAVFSVRAAEVLLRFANAGSGGNRLVITSNLVEGSLIPALAGIGLPKAERPNRVVDLLELARPTAAVRILHDEYAQVRDLLLGVGS